VQKIKKAKDGHKQLQKGQIKAKFSSKSDKIQSWNFIKYCNFCSDFSQIGFKIDYFL